MKRVRRSLSAVWEFIVGDDWRTAIGVVLALALTALIANAGISAWWVMPVAILGLLALSVRRAARSATEEGGPKRKPGRMRGRVRMADDFDELPEEVARALGTVDVE
jgi:hypothetical protein